MFRLGIRHFTTTARKAAEVASKIDMANQYGVNVAKAQGHVDGFVGGTCQASNRRQPLR